MNEFNGLWLVDGWEGNQCVFSNKDRAFNELHRRLSLCEDWLDAEVECLDADDDSEHWLVYDNGDEFYLGIDFIPFFD